MYRLILSILACVTLADRAAGTEIPSVHRGLEVNVQGALVYSNDETGTLTPDTSTYAYNLTQMRRNPVGTERGIAFDFQREDFDGTIYYGLMDEPGNVKYVLPVFRSASATIENGRAEIDIRKTIAGKYDFVDWQKTGRLRLGYRVVASDGQIIYDGRVRLRGTGPFRVDTTIIEGPHLSIVDGHRLSVRFVTNYPCLAKLAIDGDTLQDNPAAELHEFTLPELPPGEYEYTAHYAEYEETYNLTAPAAVGSREPFTFAYASDCRGGAGGGERDIWGVNAYMVKRIGALVAKEDASFCQFTGDVIDGYMHSIDATNLQYANFKRALEPWSYYVPFTIGFGNHEALVYEFVKGKENVEVDRFPYDTESAEAIFAANFANPHNGPSSEDGTDYDPNPNATDFPPYDETTFWYAWHNVAIISLNSNYWYSPTIQSHPASGGNLHGYIMDRQLAWVRKVLESLEADDRIDHIFITSHTPIFPNGGHVKDDMWYNGSNEPRPTVAGRPVKAGIIERRDQLLDLLMNHSTKVRAALTGDEHNYSLLRIDESVPIYPAGWEGERLSNFRPIWQINNGAAGAPYYGREETPWAEYVRAFSTQNAVVFIHVDGSRLTCEVINPDTYESIDRFEL